MATAPAPTFSNEDIENIMRQTECYDVSQIKASLVKHRGNVVDVVCDLLNIEAQPRPKISSKFEAVRCILDEKDRIFHKVMEEARNEQIQKQDTKAYKEVG